MYRQKWGGDRDSIVEWDSRDDWTHKERSTLTLGSDGSKLEQGLENLEGAGDYLRGRVWYFVSCLTL